MLLLGQGAKYVIGEFMSSSIAVIKGRHLDKRGAT